MATASHYEIALPPKGCSVLLSSAVEGADEVFDVTLTSNCIGAAVLIYELAERLDLVFVDALADLLGVGRSHPFGHGTGLAYIEHPALGKAVLRYGSREIRHTLLLTVRFAQREVFEKALVQAARLIGSG